MCFYLTVMKAFKKIGFSVEVVSKDFNFSRLKKILENSEFAVYETGR